MNARNIAIFVLGALAALGTIAGARLSLSHLEHGEVCPMLGPLPACIVVFLGYLFILIATFIIRQDKSKLLFFIGWIPVVGLASIGVVLELVRGDTCPPGGFGIPQCFYSLAMAITVFVLFFFVRKKTLFNSKLME